LELAGPVETTIMSGQRRRNDQDELERLRNEQLAFLRGVRKNAVSSLRRLSRRSGTSSAPLAR
jgi:hypothetical protein